VLVLTSIGVAAAGASTVALLNRLVNYLSLALAGVVVFCLRSTRNTRAPMLAQGPSRSLNWT
ncbi:MAG: hypothetical protein JO352_07005, partial [Chloroflexi bacterium]|nr:hypothetical protein [Chloroflexota bacterium]